MGHIALVNENLRREKNFSYSSFNFMIAIVTFRSFNILKHLHPLFWPDRGMGQPEKGQNQRSLKKVSDVQSWSQVSDGLHGALNRWEFFLLSAGWGCVYDKGRVRASQFSCQSTGTRWNKYLSFEKSLYGLGHSSGMENGRQDWYSCKLGLLFCLGIIVLLVPLSVKDRSEEPPTSVGERTWC